MIVTGERSLLQLRTQLMDAEIDAYAIFNQFKDEKRFHISCAKQPPTGSNIRNRFCQPAFEIEAMAGLARDYGERLRSLLDPYNLDYTPQIAYQQPEVIIAAQ